MAPEQVEGREADARTDIWALGCLLYEMISGQRAFEGPSPASVIAAILERELPAPAVESLNATGRLWDVIRTCLEKDPDNRWQSAHDLGRELRWTANAPSVAASSRSDGIGCRPLVLAVLTLAVGGAIGVSGSWLWARPSRAASALRSGLPVVVLMDSPHPERVYDDETRKAGGTNADDLTDLLRDLPIVLLKENTNVTWHRESEVLQQDPALIVAHRSCFYDATILGEASRAAVHQLVVGQVRGLRRIHRDRKSSDARAGIFARLLARRGRNRSLDPHDGAAVSADPRPARRDARAPRSRHLQESGHGF